jgi:hypothetical protein
MLCKRRRKMHYSPAKGKNPLEFCKSSAVFAVRRVDIYW